ncbi:MAG TPA: hypothetical protein VGN14_01650 [Candidatus Elarobacter sp.]
MTRFRLLALAALYAAGLLPAAAAPLPRANVVLPSAIALDLAANTVTLPLYRGTSHGTTVWYVKTDVSDPTVAKREGLLYSPALAAIGDAGSQIVSGSSSAFVFAGGVDFTPERVLTVGADGAPTAAKPGSVGDAEYSPFVHRHGSAVIYNAPIVASGEHPSDTAGHGDTLDRVVAIDTRDAKHARVTLVLARGYTNGRPIAYISTDASADGPAAIERSTYAPKLANAGRGAAIPIYVFFNGATGSQGQGIPYAALRGHLTADASAANAASLGSPLNIQATFPNADNGPSGYSPLWNVAPAAWTASALAGGKAHRIATLAGVDAAAHAGLVTAPDGKPFGPAPIVVNCPVVGFAEARP